MRLPLPLTAALAACFLLASCSSWAPPVNGLPKPLPVESLALCPPPVASDNPHIDAVAVTLKQMYDLYGLCAGRHFELVDHLDQL